LHRLLFGQLEKLADEEISGVDLEREIRRTDAMVAVGTSLLKGYDIMLKVAVMRSNIGGGNIELPPQLGGPVIDAQIGGGDDGN